MVTEFMVTPWHHHNPPRVVADQRSCHGVNEDEGRLKKREHFTSMQVLAYYRLGAPVTRVSACRELRKSTVLEARGIQLCETRASELLWLVRFNLCEMDTEIWGACIPTRRFTLNFDKLGSASHERRCMESKEAVLHQTNQRK